MSAAEQLEDPSRHPRAAARCAARGGGLHRGPADAVAGEDPRRACAAAGAGALCRALPAAGRSSRLISLTVAAITTLVVPVAVRRMIDFGFSPEGIALINSYFSVMIAVVAVLAAASASRYYLVDDDRRAHRRRSPARRVRASGLAVARVLRFRALGRTGVAADRRYHADQVRGRRLGIDRAAQHDAVHRRHRDDGDHEPEAVRLRAAGDPADRDSAGRVRALGAAAVAQRPGYAGRRQRLRAPN